MAIYIPETDVVELLTMPDAIRAVEAMFRRWAEGKVVNHTRRRIRVPSGYLMIMDGADMEEGAGFKAYTATGPRTNMLVNLYSSKTGELLAVIEANHLGAMRTGAATGVAVAHLSASDASTVGVIGSGRQAETQLVAICAVRSIRRIRVFSRSAERREAFAAKMGAALNVPTEPVGSARECVTDASIIVTATPSREPVFEGSWLSPGALVVAAGSNMWQRREIDEATIARSELIVVDDLDTARAEAGELIWAVERGVFRWEQAIELRDIVAGRVPGKTSTGGVTLFESQGLAVEDLAVAWRVWQLASTRTGGVTLPIAMASR